MCADATWKVWREDGTDTLAESTDRAECLRIACAAWLAGNPVVLEDPDGVNYGRDDVRKLRARKNSRNALVPGVVSLRAQRDGG